PVTTPARGRTRDGASSSCQGSAGAASARSCWTDHGGRASTPAPRARITGALFGVFNYRGDPGLAYFYFKDIGGYVADEFFVRNGAAGASPACTSAGCDCRDRPDGAPCDDGNACTVDDACLGGACGGMPQGCHGGGCTGSPLACDDGDACTEDACDPAAG